LVGETEAEADTVYEYDVLAVGETVGYGGLEGHVCE
jgi:hypothetical protein